MEQVSGLINKLNLTSGKMGTTSQIFNMWCVLLNDVTCVKHGKKILGTTLPTFSGYKDVDKSFINNFIYCFYVHLQMRHRQLSRALE